MSERGSNTRFIVNPFSGRHRNPRAVMERLRAAVKTHAAGGEILVTQRAGHAGELAREALADGCGLIVAVGGDGTVNEVARPLIGGRAALGLVPRGSGNGLARHLRIPLGLEAAVVSAVQGKELVMDTGLANGHPFLNVMGMGLDADVGAKMEGLASRGPWPYFKIAASAAWSYRPVTCGISTDGWRERRAVWLVAVANSDQWGNNARIAPGARVDDGLLDLVVVGPVPRWRAPALALRLFSGGFDRHPLVVRRQTAEVVLHREQGGCFHTDGEIHPTGPEMVIKVVPASLRIKVPAEMGY